MKKGFTLIELLAVIVILAIIALIATPIVLNIISDSKESSVERSAELYMDAVEKAIIKENLKRKFNPLECIVRNDGNLICDNDTENVLAIEMQGKKPTEGVLTISNSKIENFKNLKYDTEYVSKGKDNNYIVTTTKQEDEIGPKIISFTVDGTIGHAEEGMTWEELANNNEYNTFGVSTGICMENNLCIGTTDRGIYDKEELRFVTSEDVIKENGSYIIEDY